jgi:hypothetical protein
MFTVDFTRQEALKLFLNAKEKHFRYSKMQKEGLLGTGTHVNTEFTHFVGILGEHAAFAWLKYAGHKPEAVFMDRSRDNDCDIVCGTDRMEVKTWSEQSLWENVGRSIRIYSYEKLVLQTDILVWCLAEGIENFRRDGVRVTVHGFVTMSEFDRMKFICQHAHSRYQCDHYWDTSKYGE